MDYNKVEDAVLKKAMEFFKDNAVKFFGIDTKIIAPAETEIKNIDIKTNYTDYLFYTEDGGYLHFEFQTTNKKEDIKRFLYYDASLFYKEKRKVRTFVIYSSDIDDVETFVDAGTITVFVPAEEIGMVGSESPQEIEANKDLTNLIEAIRGKACELIGMVDNWENALKETPYLPFLVTVAKPTDYVCFTGQKVNAEDIDLVARLSSMGVINKTFAGSGTVATGAAARIVGSVVYDILSTEAHQHSQLYIGHGAGRIPVEVMAKEIEGQFVIEKITIYRTARILMEGYAYVKKSCLI